MRFDATQFIQQLKATPSPIVDFAESDEVVMIVDTIAQTHKLSDGKTAVLASQIGYVLVGLMQQGDFHTSVMRELNLRPSEADAIADEVAKKIFTPAFLLAAAPHSDTMPAASAPRIPLPQEHIPTPQPSVQSGAWPISLNPVVTEAQPKQPRTYQAPVIPPAAPASTLTPSMQTPPPTPRPQAPVPPPPKEELIVPHKVAPGHTSNMPGMRHPWLSDAMKLPDTATTAPNEVKQIEKKGLTEKSKPPVAEISKTVPTPPKPATVAAEMNPAKIESTEAKKAETTINAPVRSPEAPTKPAAPSPATTSVLQKTSQSSPVSTANNTQEQQTSPEVIMPGKGVNIPVPKMVSRLPIEERESSRITIVRKTSEPQVKSQATQSIPSPAPTKTPAPVSASVANTDSKTISSPKPTTNTESIPESRTVESTSASLTPKSPAPGTTSPVVVSPSKMSAPATTPPAPPLYTGKDPYREPVN